MRSRISSRVSGSESSDSRTT